MDARLVTALILALGCREPDDTGDDTGDTGEPDPLVVTEMPTTLVVGATDDSVPLPFDLDAAGSGTGVVGDFALTANVGTIELDSAAVATFVYEQQPWPAYGLTLYQGFAVAPERWDVFWLYCYDNGDVATLWDQQIGVTPLRDVGASGTCDVTYAPVVSEVALPALSLELPTPKTDYTVDGPDVIVQSDGFGAVRVDDRSVPLAVFEVVDCGECSIPGWTELHFIAWDDPDAIFAILYLIEGDATHVQIAYGRSIPALENPWGGYVTVPADWTTPGIPARSAPRGFVPPPGVTALPGSPRRPASGPP